MYTVCWNGIKNGDGWDRFESRDYVVKFVNELIDNGEITGEYDVLIFPPEVDDLLIDLI